MSSKDAQIVLAGSPGATYSTGSIVKGEIVINLKKPIVLREAVVSLTGSSSCEIYRRVFVNITRRWFSEQHFFVAAHTIPLGGREWPPGQHRFPFEIVFPGMAVPPTGPNQWVPQPPFELQQRHPLPPTFNYRLLMLWYRQSASCRYKLDARIFRSEEDEKKFFTVDFYVRPLELLYTSSRTTATPDPQLRIEKRVHGAVELLLQVPQNGILTQQLQLSVGIQGQNQVVLLQRLKVELKAQRTFRCGTKQQFSNSSILLFDWTKMHMLLPPGQMLPLTAIAEGGGVILPTVIPNFRTFNVALPEYVMTIQYAIVVDGKVLKGTVKVDPFQVLPAVYVPL